MKEEKKSERIEEIAAHMKRLTRKLVRDEGGGRRKIRVGA